MAIFLIVLLVAGGASRGDVAGQVVVRSAAWSVIGILALFGPIPSWKSTGPALGFLMAMAVVAVLQIVPLPPAIWQALPGHQPAVEASALAGQPQSWRPLSIVPSASWNALSSLIVPATILLLWAELTSEERALLPGLLTIMIGLAAFVGLLQMTGAGFDNPLINETSWDVRGTLANRNHFAVLLALGCMIAPTWALHNRTRRGWRTPLAIGLLLIFLLMILATGSRAGLLSGLIALGFVGFSTGVKWRSAPRWMLPAAAAALILLVVATLIAGRAMSIDRALSIDPAQDMRSRSLPWVMMLIHRYFPFGAGLGSFDPTFRMVEPFSMLKPTYFNHAHNDIFEIALTSGVMGLAILLAALIWVLSRAIRVWRMPIVSRDVVLARLGATMLILIFIASLFDYPARTPFMMTMIVFAALWLGNGRTQPGSAGLPAARRHL